LSQIKKILIVDDDPDIREGLRLRLKAHRYETVFAEDAATATVVARREQPDVILLDIGLPGGDGFMVLERLRAMEDLAHIPVIVVSARDPVMIKDQLFGAGADGFFQKPIDNEQLLQVLAATI